MTPAWQNLLHIPVFGGFAMSWWWALEHRLPQRRQRAYAALTVTLAYAAVDEFWQSTIPGRLGSVIDFCLDAAGAWLAIRYLTPLISDRTGN